MDKKFTRTLIGKSVAKTTSFMFATFFAWRIIVNYNSVFLVSIIPTLATLGYIIILIPEGYILDKFDRAKIMFLSAVLSFLIYLPLLFSSSLVVVYSIDLLSSISSFIISDVFRTIIKDLVSNEELPKAFSYNTIGDAASGIFGVILGGISAAFFPIIFPYLIILIALASMPLLYPVKTTPFKPSNLSYSHAIKIIKLFLPFLIVTLIINGVFVVLDVYASGYFYDVLHSNAIAYTAFILAYLIGTLIGGSIGSKIAEKLLNAKIIALFIASFSIIFYLIVAIKIAYVQPIFTLITGLEVSLINIPLSAMLTRIIPSEILGKVNSLMTIFLTSSSPVMAIFYGLLSNFLSITSVFTIVGIFMLLFSIPVYIVSKKILEVKEEDIRKMLHV